MLQIYTHLPVMLEALRVRHTSAIQQALAKYACTATIANCLKMCEFSTAVLVQLHHIIIQVRHLDLEFSTVDLTNRELGTL